MSKAWKELDLEGGGLQSVNARLAREMRTRPAAYAAWVLFPLGLHRFYLREPLGGTSFLLLGAATLASVLFAPASWWLAPLGIGVLWALVDLWWIDRRVTDYNKELRKQVFLRKGHKPPQDYRGRYTSDEDARRELDEYRQIKEAEKPGQSGLAGANDQDRDVGGKRRMPSFNEQEAMLRQMRKDRNEGDDKG
ncbi:TM2 domain-containing protein [Thioalkalivibrio sp.]|uniref:TM2 domain-containing protein n=1 Tax=Thioalkalivibrio sp. TaxID=2093813 RepID=UPI003567945C